MNYLVPFLNSKDHLLLCDLVTLITLNYLCKNINFIFVLNSIIETLI